MKQEEIEKIRESVVELDKIVKDLRGIVQERLPEEVLVLGGLGWMQLHVDKIKKVLE